MIMESPEAAVALLVWIYIKEMTDGDNGAYWYYKLKLHSAQLRWVDLKAGFFFSGKHGTKSSPLILWYDYLKHLKIKGLFLVR